MPYDYNSADQMQQGIGMLGQGIQQGWEAARQRTADNQHIPDAWHQFIQRLMRGEDPVALGREAAAHPDIRAMQELFKGVRGPAAAPRGTVPDAGMVGGRPMVQAPGAVNPAGAGPRSLGDIQQQSHVGAAQAVGGYSPPEQSLAAGGMPFAGANVPGPGPDSGLDASTALGRMGQPMQGAPQVQPQQAGARALPPSAPQQPQQNSPVAAGNGGFTTVKQFRQLAPFLPAMIAAQGRGDAANATANMKLQVANLNATKSVLLGIMKENGQSDRFGELLQSVAEKYDISQQQAVLQAMVDMYKADKGAEATLGAAGIKATAAAKDPREKELSDVQKGLNVINGNPEYKQSPAGQADWQRLQARLGELQRELGREGASTPPPLVGPQPPGGGTFGQPGKKPSPASQKPSTSTKASFRIRYRPGTKYAGKTGQATDQTFNPQTMERLP